MPGVGSEIEVLPAALTRRDQWVCWRREDRNDKTTKVPVEPSTGDYASTNDPATWTTLETAVEAVEEADADGIGFVFTDEDPFVGVDLDNCRNPDSWTIDAWARAVIARLESYAEVSPSGTGVHVIAEGELPDGRSRSGDVEMYETSRFFTVTGDHLDQTPTDVHRRTDAIRGVHADYVQQSTDTDGSDEAPSRDSQGNVDLRDEEILERARAAENGDRFDALWRGQTAGYDSHSEADMALCLHLAFWTGGSPVQMDAFFRRSGLMREKWDEVHYADGATYGERTIERAVDMVDEVYEPDQDPDQEAATSQFSLPAGESGSADPDSSGTSTNREDAVYLEERNRLLREKVQSQSATIQQQRDRLDQLEDALEHVRDQPAIQEPGATLSDTEETRSGFWGWLRDR